MKSFLPDMAALFDQPLSEKNLTSLEKLIPTKILISRKQEKSYSDSKICVPVIVGLSQFRYEEIQKYINQFGYLSFMTPKSYKKEIRMIDVFFSETCKSSEFGAYIDKENKSTAVPKLFLGLGAIHCVNEHRHPGALKVALSSEFVSAHLTHAAKTMLGIPEEFKSTIMHFKDCYLVRRYALSTSCIPLATYDKMGETYVAAWYDSDENSYHICGNSEKVSNLETSKVYSHTNFGTGCLLSSFIFNHAYKTQFCQ